MSQSNTITADFPVTAGEDLSTFADLLVAPYNSGTSLVVTRPVANNDSAVYLLVFGATPGNKASVRPLTPQQDVRVVAKGAGSPGDLLVLADGVTVPADRGKVRSKASLTVGSGTYRLVGLAEESFTDGQLVRMRPTYGTVTV